MINNIIQGFNWALDRLRANKNHDTFLVNVLNVNKKIGTYKEFIISLYLINNKDGSRQLVYRNKHTRECPAQDTNKVLNELYEVVLSDLFILFRAHGKEMSEGTFKSPLENIDLIHSLPDQKD